MRTDEYQLMFGLSADDLNGRILEFSDASSTMKDVVGLAHTVTHCKPAANKTLVFDDFTFDLALCPYYLFMPVQSVDASLQVIRELARVAKEVRIFPLSDTHGLPSPLLGPVLLGLNQENYGVEVRDVTSSLKPKGNAMLRVWAQQCQVS